MKKHIINIIRGHKCKELDCKTILSSNSPAYCPLHNKKNIKDTLPVIEVL